MASKAQLCRKRYGCTLSELTTGEKAQVTKDYKNQSSAPVTKKTPRTDGMNVVKFARPGVNGIKECLVSAGTTYGDALKQGGLELNASKEGIVNKKTGAILMFADIITEDVMAVITLGVDSSI